VDNNVLTRASLYLKSLQYDITQNTTTSNLDNAAFIQFALSEAALSDVQILGRLYDERNRMSPAGRAWAAYSFYKVNPADPRARELISNLEASAILTASSAHWETPYENSFIRGSTIYTTSAVVYAIAHIDPTNRVLLGAVRYLAAHRNANKLWNLGHDNSWAILALTEALVGIGDMQSDFSFNAALNGKPLTSGDVAGVQIEPLTANVPMETLAANQASLLTINRTAGLGSLYYNAVLNVNRPVERVFQPDPDLALM
jgi:hypothetical protein